MFELDNKSKKIFYLVVLILTLIISCIGVALALYNVVLSGDEEGEKLYTGTLEINYHDGVVIENPILWPISEPSLDDVNNVYKNNFSIESTGTLSQNLSIYLDITINEFEQDSIKYAIYDSNGTKISKGNVPLSGRITMASGVFLESNTTGNYTMLLWLDDNNTDQNYLQGKKISGTISVLADQYR